VDPTTTPAADAIRRSLDGFPIFAALDAASLDALAAVGHLRRWDSGQVIFQRGDEGAYMLAITEGRVRLALASPEGRELVLRHVGPGDVIGELAVIDGRSRSADALAVEPLTALVFHRDRFLGIAAERPAMGLALAGYLCSLLRSTNFQMESIALYDLQRRLVRFLLFTLRHRYGEEIPEEPAISLGLNQSDLSAVLGASRPKVNHALQVLIAGGALGRDGDRLICNLDALQAIADIDDLDDR
jgi:CRP-like cAMP-binding protein